MPTGHFRGSGSPMVWLTLAGNTFEAVLDTGFEGGLQLPDAWRIPLLPLLTRPHQQLTYQLPDGRLTKKYSFWLDIDLGGDQLVVETIFMDSDEILLGVDALRDYRLTVDFPAGMVAVDRATP